MGDGPHFHSLDAAAGAHCMLICGKSAAAAAAAAAAGMEGGAAFKNGAFQGPTGAAVTWVITGTAGKRRGFDDAGLATAAAAGIKLRSLAKSIAFIITFTILLLVLLLLLLLLLQLFAKVQHIAALCLENEARAIVTVPACTITRLKRRSMLFAVRKFAVERLQGSLD